MPPVHWCSSSRRSRTSTNQARPWALYDTGQAVAALTVQAEADGLAVHQMGGFDAAAVRSRFDLANALMPVVVLAVGRRDPEAKLSEPFAAREVAPRSREPLDALLLAPLSRQVHRAA